MPDSITLNFKIEKETKNTIRYSVVEEFGAITTLYINKRDLKDTWGDYPNELEVVVTKK